MAMSSMLVACAFPSTPFEMGQTNQGIRTPWLTTRRRTCPICKGDVVRGAAAGGPGPSWGRHSDAGEASERTPLVTGDGEEEV